MNIVQMSAMSATSSVLPSVDGTRPVLRLAENGKYYVVDTPPPQAPGGASSSSNVGETTANQAAISAATHLSSGQVLVGQQRRKRRSGKMAPLAKEGEVISKLFNEVAGRPYPVFNRLEQEIRVVMIGSVNTFLTTNTVSQVVATQAFALNAVADYSQFLAVFDQYRISQIEVWLEPVGSQEATFAGLATAVDLDDSNNPSTIANVQAKQGAIMAGGGSSRYHRWQPHVAVATYSGTFTSYGNVPSMWIDAASPSVQHYGFKAAALPTPSGAITYSLTYRYVVDFRAPGL